MKFLSTIGETGIFGATVLRLRLTCFEPVWPRLVKIQIFQAKIAIFQAEFVVYDLQIGVFPVNTDNVHFKVNTFPAKMSAFKVNLEILK